MVELADKARREYEPHAPVFQRRAANARDAHRPWLSGLVENPDAGTFVHEDPDGCADGFAVITTLPAPPVYDPGGLSSLIDDFAVLSGEVGDRRCDPVHDEPKRAVLQDAGLYVASEWFTAPLES